MKHTNYSKAETLEQAHQINESSWGVNNSKRYNDLMYYASQCKSVMELGVHQGSSLTAILMTKPEKAIGVDVNLNLWKNGSETAGPGLQERAKIFAEENGIELEVIGCSSINPLCKRQVEMLHIDSLHDSNHLRKELNLHANNVSKYIMFHDTAVNNYMLYNTIIQYIKDNGNQWKEVLHYDENNTVGHLVIERVK